MIIEIYVKKFCCLTQECYNIFPKRCPLKGHTYLHKTAELFLVEKRAVRLIYLKNSCQVILAGWTSCFSIKRNVWELFMWQDAATFKKSSQGLEIHTLQLIGNFRFSKFYHNLKVVSATFLVVCFVYLDERTCETKKHVFFFTLKALFVLEIIKF